MTQLYGIEINYAILEDEERWELLPVVFEDVAERDQCIARMPTKASRVRGIQVSFFSKFVPANV